MNDPLKIIHKFKNRNKRIQYTIYIFVGDILNETVKKVLTKIQPYDLFDAWTNLTVRELGIITKEYGEFWYEKFFNMHHINFTKDTITKNPAKFNELKEKYPAEWIKTHITDYRKRIDNLTYTYEYTIKDTRDRKTKTITQRLQDDGEDLIDYTTGLSSAQFGGVVSESKSQNYTTGLSGQFGGQGGRVVSGQNDRNYTTGLSGQFGGAIDNTPSPSQVKQYGNQVEKLTDKGNRFGNAYTLPENVHVDPDLTKLHNQSGGYGLYGDQSKPYQIADAGQNWCENQEGGRYDKVHYNMYGGVIDNTDPPLQVKQYGNQVEKLTDKGNRFGNAYTLPENAHVDPDLLELHNREQVGGFDDVDGDQIADDVNDMDNFFFDQMVADDVADIFSNIDQIDENVKQTTSELKKTINAEDYNKSSQILDFDESKSDILFDATLRDVIDKTYVYNQYIYRDDMIKVIRQKICCAFKNSVIYGDKAYITPSDQYLWSEYMYKGAIEQVMIGQLWTVKNNVLRINVEPRNKLSVYEELRDNLKQLRDNIRRQGRIKREDDENLILLDYDNYMTYGELYMIDIYNELGVGYNPSPEDLKNLNDVYLRIYFPYITPNDMISIMELLQSNNPGKTLEAEKTKLVHDSMLNDLIMDNSIMRDIELTKKNDKSHYEKLFKENYVVQSFVRAYLLDVNQHIDLYRVFDKFVLDEDYPFIQYQPIDGTPYYRYSEEYLSYNDRKDIVAKWFENAPYGISFKVKVSSNPNKFMSVKLVDTGQIEYKIQWKEEEASTMDDIKKTYPFVKRLIQKINRENNSIVSVQLKIPTDDDFKFAFINTIQKFMLPENFTIEHNNLSNFSRYFYPYVALVIDPRKRLGKQKIDEEKKSKYGTYLRYKRIGRYDNRSKIEYRVLFFMRNYEYTDQSLSDELAKEFNITEEQAYQEIVNIRQKYPAIKKARKVLKKMENIPKFKPPGIEVGIQGKSRDNYKIRVSGARDKDQLLRILEFMNIFIYLYSEVYLYKRPDKQKMKDKLVKLTKIAERKNKVVDVTDTSKETKTIKQMAMIDKARIGYSATADRNNWPRDCQESGTTKRRQPAQFLDVDDLQNEGYVWTEELDGQKFGHYARKIREGGKDIYLRAMKLPLTEDKDVYYVCGPEKNGRHKYVGFLSKSKNPCCFIKDQLYSNNKAKRNYYLQSIGLLNEEEEPNQIFENQLYILQDSNKIQEGRFAFLPKSLDIFMNTMQNKTKVIKNHYLESSETGYYFKYGVRKDNLRFLNAVAVSFDLTAEALRQLMIQAIKADKNQSFYTSLNNGDIRSQFGNIQNYLTFLEDSNYLDDPMVTDLLSVPGVVTEFGINIVIFQKKTSVISNKLEREKIKEDYYIICRNPENVNNLIDPDRETIIMIKEQKNYYPVIMVSKQDELSKEVYIQKTYTYDPSNNNLVNHVLGYYNINCSNKNNMVKDQQFGQQTAKQTFDTLIATEDKNFEPRSQIIDGRYKCRYLITRAGYIIPVLPSGAIAGLTISPKIDRFIKDYGSTFKYLTELSDICKAMKIPMTRRPIGVFYSEKRGKSLLISAIMTEMKYSVPITERSMTADYAEKHNLIIDKKPDDIQVDIEIAKGPNNMIVDERIRAVTKNNYYDELYQLFRYHLSYFLNNVPEGLRIKAEIERIIISDYPKVQKKNMLKQTLYNSIDKGLATKFEELVKKIGHTRTEEYDRQDGGELTGGDEPTIREGTIAVNDDLVLADSINPVDIGDSMPEEIRVVPHDVYRNSEDFEKPQPRKVKAANFATNQKAWMQMTKNHLDADYSKYVLKNNRELCYDATSKDSCPLTHCQWQASKKMCMFNMQERQLIDTVNRVTEELVNNSLHASEILRRNNYYVSDIVDYSIFTERPGERIITTANANINKILSEIFGKDGVPSLGRRRVKGDTIQTAEQLNTNNPMHDSMNMYVQEIIPNNNTILRAFTNSYYWLMHPYDDNSGRNLGYYSELQTKLSTIYKSQVIDKLIAGHKKVTKANVLPRNVSAEKYATDLSGSVTTNSNGLAELIILSEIYQTIIYIRDENMDVIYVIHPKSGLVYNHDKANEPFDTSIYRNYKKNLELRYLYDRNKNMPAHVDVLYQK